MECGTQLEEIVLGWGVLGDSVLSWSFLLLPPSAYCLPFCELFPHTFGWDETRSQNSYFLPLTYSAVISPPLQADTLLRSEED